jgi:hypothetical protein
VKGATLGAIAVAAVLLAPSRARADGLHGRFDGDLEIRAGAGVGIAGGGPMLAAELAARYLCSAGVFVHYADGLGTRLPRIARSIAAGVEIAPLFLARYASDLESGPPRLDLLVDSIAFGVGAFWAAPPRDAFEPTPGIEISLGLAIPIFGRATGPFVRVRGALRWRDVDLAPSSKGASFVDRGALLSITLGWHHVVRTGLVDPGDGVSR